MAGERLKLEVKERESRGSADARRLRANGVVPGVLYGGGKRPHPFTVEERELRKALTGEHGLHAILDILFEGQKTPHHAVLKEYQLDPVRTRLLHIDLHEVRLDQPIQAQVVVALVGESQGVKEGGVLTLVLRDVNVQALPMEVPDGLELDISGMAIGDSLRVSDLRIPDGVTVLDDPEAVVTTVTPPTKVELPEEVEVEEEEALEGEELLEGEVEEGEEAPTAEGEPPEEPEES
jgi:large subunit ribosomal protein L25